MALPIIAAGVAARYGAKKLAKALVKRNTKKVKKPQKLKNYKTRVESDDDYGMITTRPIGGKAKSIRAFEKKVSKKGETIMGKTEKVQYPWKASQERKVRDILERRDMHRGNYTHPAAPGYSPKQLGQAPRYVVKRPRNK